eukprot:1160868-Pelagomonas_calceolata.AAC.4
MVRGPAAVVPPEAANGKKLWPGRLVLPFVNVWIGFLTQVKGWMKYLLGRRSQWMCAVDKDELGTAVFVGMQCHDH